MPARCAFESGEGDRCPEAARLYDDRGKRRWCAAHAPQGSGRSKPGRVCEVCAKNAVYGHPPTRCADHVTSRSTECEGCGLHPVTTIVHVTSKGRGAGARLCDACAGDAVKHCEDSRRSWKPQCVHVDDDGVRCTKTRSYGFEYGAALFCATHRQPGTVNVRTKSRCQVEKCRQPAEYGDVHNRWCKTHTQTTERCAYLVCEAPACLRHATHALRGDAFAKQLRWCDCHAPASARLVFQPA